MLPGDLVLVRGKGFISQEIEKVTHSQYSHVAGFITYGSSLMEAQGWRKTGYVKLQQYQGSSDLFTCELTPYQRYIIVNYVRSKLGTRYNYLLIGWEVIRYLLRLALPFYEGNSFICSTLWAEAYREAGVDLCPGIKYPSPGDLAQSKLLRRVRSY